MKFCECDHSSCQITYKRKFFIKNLPYLFQKSDDSFIIILWASRQKYLIQILFFYHVFEDRDSNLWYE